MTSRSTLPLVVAALLMAGCAAEPQPAPAPDTSADEAAVRAVADRELMLASSDDPTSFTELLTSDAITMPPGEPTVSGDALTQWVNDFMAAVTVSDARYEHEEVTVLGDVAIHRFRFSWTITPKAGGDPVTQTGKGLHIMRRQADGSWKISRDVWNTDAM